MSQPNFSTGDTRFCIPGPAGQLELATLVPKQINSEVIVVICHPDPVQQGTMNNKVVTTIARSLRDLGVRSVRFNYRGVGNSQGTHDDGNGESQDCLAVLAWLQQQQATVALAGFSFGAYVALRAANSCDSLAFLLNIAPAVSLRPFETLQSPTCPWLIIQGENDEVASPTAVYTWAATLPNNARLLRMPDTSHFFHGQLIQLRKHLLTELAAYV